MTNKEPEVEFKAMLDVDQPFEKSFSKPQTSLVIPPGFTLEMFADSIKHNAIDDPSLIKAFEIDV